MQNYSNKPWNLNESTFLPVKMETYRDIVTALLVVDKAEIRKGAKKEEANKLWLLEKETFHFTIIWMATGAAILATTEWSTKKEETLDKVFELCNSFELKAQLKDDFYYIEKKYNDSDPNNPGDMLPEETRRSIIQTAEINGLDEFYKQLNNLLGEKFETPYPHITLYTNSTREDKKLRWIGIYSKKQFDELNPQKI